jgi:CxxC motif-containing protein
MKKQFTCIVCPNGCEIEAEVENGQVISVTGHTCPRGEQYVRQELTAPRRTIASSVLVKGGELPVTSVRLTKAVPKDMIFPVCPSVQSNIMCAW